MLRRILREIMNKPSDNNTAIRLTQFSHGGG
jgi:hypothetical protein